MIEYIERWATEFQQFLNCQPYGIGDFALHTLKYYFEFQQQGKSYFECLVDSVENVWLRKYKLSQKHSFGIEPDDNALRQAEHFFNILLQMWIQAENVSAIPLTDKLQYLLNRCLLFIQQPPFVVGSNVKTEIQKKMIPANVQFRFLLDLKGILGNRIQTAKLDGQFMTTNKRKLESSNKFGGNTYPKCLLVKHDEEEAGWLDHGIKERRTKKKSNIASADIADQSTNKSFERTMKNINISKYKDGNLDDHYHIKIEWSLELQTANGQYDGIDCSTLSLPFLVMTSGFPQELKLHRLIFLDYMLSQDQYPKFDPILSHTRLPWSDWAYGLSCFYKRLLTAALPKDVNGVKIAHLRPDQKDHLRRRLLRNEQRINPQPTYVDPAINKVQPPELTHNKDFITKDFFDWFYTIIDMIVDKKKEMIKYKYSAFDDQRSMLSFVSMGLIHPFMSMESAIDIVGAQPNSAMLIRCSDTKVGHVTVIFKKSNGRVSSIEPVGRELLTYTLTIPGYINKVYQLRSVDYIVVKDSAGYVSVVPKSYLLEGVSSKTKSSTTVDNEHSCCGYSIPPIVALTDNDKPSAEHNCRVQKENRLIERLIHFADHPMLHKCLNELEKLEREGKLEQTKQQWQPTAQLNASFQANTSQIPVWNDTFPQQHPFLPPQPCFSQAAPKPPSFLQNQQFSNMQFVSRQPGPFQGEDMTDGYVQFPKPNVSTNVLWNQPRNNTPYVADDDYATSSSSYSSSLAVSPESSFSPSPAFPHGAHKTPISDINNETTLELGFDVVKGMKLNDDSSDSEEETTMGKNN